VELTSLARRIPAVIYQLLSLSALRSVYLGLYVCPSVNRYLLQINRIRVEPPLRWEKRLLGDAVRQIQVLHEIVLSENLVAEQQLLRQVAHVVLLSGVHLEGQLL